VDNDDLLSPSLEENVAQPIYSVGALIAAAFLGGGFAVCLLGVQNARRLRRLRRDLPWLLLAFAVAATAVIGALVYFQDAISGAISRDARLLIRGIAFALVGLMYLLHRKPYRAAQLVGIEPASPYLAVAAAVIASVVVSFGLAAAYFSITQALPPP
jgi:NADH:ubiquinone oxidoreductase subunit 5 (subunit L)/multisubunit Na+/H+ antiporter MnhA subunit